MRRYRVYQQRPPINSGVDGPSLSGADKKTPWEINLVHVGEVTAESGADAIEAAKLLPAFARVSRRTLAAYPIVEWA